MTAAIHTALVTGGSRGLGFAVARRLAQDGVRVALVARSERGVHDAVTTLRRAGCTAYGRAADVTRADTLRTALDELRCELGTVDLLVNNAGVEGPFGPLWECDPDAWWAAMDTNVRGVLLATHALLPGMLARRTGRIVNLASHAGVHRWPHVSAYSVSKAAVIKLTENLGQELRGTGVHTASLHPGIVLTGFTDAVLAGEADPASWRGRAHVWLRGQIEAGRGVPPEDAADAVAVLARRLTETSSGAYFTTETVTRLANDGAP
ncbi:MULTISPECIES: SDR family NAD(P)-dependent oxidoreductase [Streptomyces]|uniref:SDR family NAD(P)-dependent oxidoreductase n=1 Tax=Streptomyces TaxID=1883 RepID=UPI00068F8555|nr:MULTISPECIES: SDR family oxidoreductase [Streptomyces]ARP73445.1 SDR family oxidoreductase [Streptomyces pluripotens]